MKTFLLLQLLLFPLFCFSNQRYSKDQTELATELNESLIRHQMMTWYPRVVDYDEGGYLSNFDANWNALPKQEKMLVTQSRHLWTSIRLYEFCPKEAFLLDVANHGFDFLQKKMWDSHNGGLFQLVEKNGTPTESKYYGKSKTSYGNAFAIYALSAYYEITQKEEALELAKSTFYWLENYSHDEEHLGYFNAIDTQNHALTERGPKYFPKGQNTTIHLMEAFTELYRVWKNPQVKTRITELRQLLIDEMIDPRGFVRLYFARDWKHYSISGCPEEEFEGALVFDHVSFGHDVEIAYLILETYEVLEQTVEQETLRLCKLLIDHALENGWDKDNGGIFDAGFYYDTNCQIVKTSKCWWAQGELLNSLILMDHLQPDEGYFDTAVQLWKYMQGNLIDHERGGWYEYSMDTTPKGKDMQKAHVWKGAYHESRALMNVIRRLSGD